MPLNSKAKGSAGEREACQALRADALIVRSGKVFADACMDSANGVEYRPVPGWPGYCAGDDGTVWSLRMKRGEVFWKKLTTTSETASYYQVKLHGLPLRSQLWGVHLIVLTSFVGERPHPSYDACHENGNRKDNRLSNLRWDTRQSNHFDKKKHGTFQTCELHGNAKLDWERVRAIRLLFDAGESRDAIAVKYGMSRSQVYNIGRREQWKESNEQ